MKTWKVTDLSVSPPTWEMADGDKQAFAFDAEEAITGATAELIRLDTRQEAGTVEGPEIGGNVATVTVSELTRGVVYELSVTFTAAASGNRRWTRTLVLPCVA